MSEENTLNYTKAVIIKKLDDPDNDQVKKIESILETFSKKHEIEIISDKEADIKTLFIAIGGDGTMIYAAKKAVLQGSAVIGFNLGKRGFLTDISTTKRELEKTFKDLFFGNNCRVEKRNLISTIMNGEEYISLNESVVSNRYSDTILNYNLVINGQNAGNHSANSLLFATPTGSTAYSLNVGGAIIDPELGVIQVIPLAHLSYTSMMPMIFSEKVKIVMNINLRIGEEMSIKSDGQESTKYKASKNETIVISIKTMDQKVKFLHHNDWNFFEVLSEKLNWSKE